MPEFRVRSQQPVDVFDVSLAPNARGSGILVTVSDGCGNSQNIAVLMDSGLLRRIELSAEAAKKWGIQTDESGCIRTTTIRE